MNDNPQYDRETCYFCHETDTHLLETHHIVPARHGGSDDPENLVRVCPTCHERLERLYSKRFYETLGIEMTESSSDEQEEDDIEVVVGYADDGSTVRTLEDVIKELEENHSEGVPVPELKEQGLAEGMSESQFERTVRKLKERGDVYEPRNNHLRVTP